MGALRDQEEREHLAREELEREAPEGLTGNKLKHWVTERLRERQRKAGDAYGTQSQSGAASTQSGDS